MLLNKPVRLRRKTNLRNLVRENQISINDFIRPVFVTHQNDKREIPSMPGQYHFPIDKLEISIQNSMNLGVKGVILFGIPNQKDDKASDTINENGIIQRAIKQLKKSFPELIIISDACFCQYTNHGHCGLLDNDGNINNERSLLKLQKQAISHAEAGADFIAPSCMLDGMVKCIRNALDNKGFNDRGIFSYAIKYASAFYGPFRDAVDSMPKFGNRKRYQMDPSNLREAIREAKIDEYEGADIIMVKPAMPYLDVIKEVKDNILCPVSAYQVSGEYAMIKAASNNNWINEDDCIMESLLGIKRAGADIIISYFTDQVAKNLIEYNG